MNNDNTNSVFDALGFSWDRSAVARDVATHSLERVCFRFHKMLPEFVWDAGVLEGNPFTYPEVKTLLDGVTIGGRRISDQEQILNLADSAKRLLQRVKSQQFGLAKPVFCEMNGLVARKEALEWGVFRGEGQEISYSPDVALGEAGRYSPLPTVQGAALLSQVYERGRNELVSLPPFERATAFFLFGALQQFFFDGNKRTSRLMMNGILMSHGIDALSVAAVKAQEFNEKMVRFYVSKDGSEMMAFLRDCHSDARLAAAQQETPLVRETGANDETIPTKANDDDGRRQPSRSKPPGLVA